jgi:hypothetical protein
MKAIVWEDDLGKEPKITEIPDDLKRNQRRKPAQKWSRKSLNSMMTDHEVPGSAGNQRGRT